MNTLYGCGCEVDEKGNTLIRCSGHQLVAQWRQSSRDQTADYHVGVEQIVKAHTLRDCADDLAAVLEKAGRK